MSTAVPSAKVDITESTVNKINSESAKVVKAPKVAKEPKVPKAPKEPKEPKEPKVVEEVASVSAVDNLVSLIVNKRKASEDLGSDPSDSAINPLDALLCAQKVAHDAFDAAKGKIIFKF